MTLRIPPTPASDVPFVPDLRWAQQSREVPPTGLHRTICARATRPDTTRFPVGSPNAFNIKAESLRLGDFSATELGALLAQHTAETGQPWLVKALAYRAGEATPDLGQAIDAHERLIQGRKTHLDQLTDKLQEERVRRVIKPLLSGDWATVEIAGRLAVRV